MPSVRVILWSIVVLLILAAGVLYLVIRPIAETPTDVAWFSDTADVEPLPTPGPLDWLANYEEAGQNFAEYVASDPPVPTDDRRMIYLLPIGDDIGPLNQIADGLADFTGLPVAVLEPWLPAPSEIESRENAGQTQWLTHDILAELKRRLPDDAFCILGLTVTDLWTGPGSNFVFGQASLRNRVGVQSFARYGEPGSPDFRKRSFKVIAHETAHMFGIRHCIAHHCLMNGSNSRPEMDAKPMTLCPVCLHKLHHAVGFDVVRRYEDVADHLRGIGDEESAGWIERRVSRLQP
ncbi:MAG: archaemetzincin [Planctomycetota bacterium]